MKRYRPGHHCTIQDWRFLIFSIRSPFSPVLNIFIMQMVSVSPVLYISSSILPPTDVFRFTLYWTIIFYVPPFLVCGLFAFWNFAFPPSPRPKATPNDLQMSTLEAISSGSKSSLHTRQPRTNEGRSRVMFAIIVLLIFISMSLAGAVIGSAILGFATFGLYKSANFNMSTYVFLLTLSFSQHDSHLIQLGTFSACRHVCSDWPSEV